MSKSVLFILFLVALVLGCTKKMKESELAWNPYSLNEVLVFESSEKERDTIVIRKIIDDAVSSGPTPKLYRHTYLIVYRGLRFKENKFATTDVLSISSNTPDNPAGISFPLYFKNAKFAGWYNLEDLGKYPLISLTTKAGIFNDVIKLESVMYRPKRKNSVKFMYWSKKHGYLKFERADGFTWELVKKYIP